MGIVGRAAIKAGQMHIGVGVAVLASRHITTDSQLQVVGWANKHRDPSTDTVPRIFPLVDSEILIISIVPIIMERELDGDLVVHERPGQAGIGFDAIVIAVRYISRRAELETRLFRDVVDHATSRVPAIERALRATQHLDPLKIERRHRLGNHHTRIDAVLIGGHRRIG